MWTQKSFFCLNVTVTLLQSPLVCKETVQGMWLTQVLTHLPDQLYKTRGTMKNLIRGDPSFRNIIFLKVFIL